CRDRKLVTSSSLTNPSCTRVEPRRALEPPSFCAFRAFSSCSGVMIFSLTRRSPSLCDIVSLSLNEEEDLTQMCWLRGTAESHGKREQTDFVFGDRNCQCGEEARRYMHLRGTKFGREPAELKSCRCLTSFNFQPGRAGLFGCQSCDKGKGIGRPSLTGPALVPSGSLAAQRLADFRKVMPAVAQGMVLDDELRGNRRAE